MSTKILTPINDDLSVRAVIHTANLDKNTLVKITADAKVDLCDTEDDYPIGFVLVPARVADGKGTVQTRFDYMATAECDGAIAAGEFVKVGENVGGGQTFAKHTPGTDAQHLMIGICWIGAADTATGTFLIF